MRDVRNYNQCEIINKLSELVVKNGIIVITCDDIGFYIEMMKRLVGVALTSSMPEVLLCIQGEESIDMENYPHFFAVFGRTQQYISFVKK